MRRSISFLLFSALTLAAAPKAPLTLPDILSWKRIQSPVVSNDGKWFAYKLVPNDGDSEIVVRSLTDGKETRYSLGAVPRPDPNLPPGPGAGGSGRGNDLVFSEDSKWIAMQTYPTGKEGKLLKKQRKPATTKAILVELATGKKLEFENIRRFAFAGESAKVIALHRAPTAAAGPPAAPAAPGASKPDEKVSGTDLLIHDLATGADFNVGNVAEFAFDKKGNWLAWLVDAQDKLGNGIELRDLTSGAVLSLDTAKASYKGLTWTEKGDGLTVLRGVDDKAWEDKLYSLVAFKNFRTGAAPEKTIFDPAADPAFPKGLTINPARNAAWMSDLSELTFTIHEVKPKAKKPEDTDAGEPKPDMVIWHYRDNRLQPMQQVQEAADKSFGYAAGYLPAQKKFVQLADASLKNVGMNPDSKFGVGTDVREYEWMSNLDGRRYQDLYVVNPKTGERKLAVRKVRWFEGASPDGSRFLYYDDGNFFSYDMERGESKNITKAMPTSFIDVEDDHNVAKPPTRSLGFSADNKFVLLSDGWDLWKVSTDGSAAAVNLTGNGKKDKIHYRSVFRLDPDDKGIDFSKPLYVSAQHETTKQGGIGVISPSVTGVKMLHFDNAMYSALLKARKADVYLYSRETTTEAPDFYLSGADLAGKTKVSSSNPQQENFAWPSQVRLIEYTGIKGDKLQGALWLPANYEAGKKYPVLVYIYEKLTQNTYAYPFPGYNGFSISAYTSNGYAVLEPDITYRVNDPGLSGATAIINALKAAIATGIVDKDRAALHGHSWGGYQTAFTVTQTNMFKAAIAGAPLTDMVSMYSSIYWNTGSANQPIFESSQGRFTGGYIEETQSYIRNSPVYFANKVTTPLMILHNDKDGAVDHTQGIEYYNTLRRLGKQVIMLEYKGENHGLRKPENMKDYTVRMKEFFDYYLMDKPAPKWLLEGIPRLKMQEHLEEREKLITGTPVQGETKETAAKQE